METYIIARVRSFYGDRPGEAAYYYIDRAGEGDWTDDITDAREFDNAEEARARMEELDSGVYVTAHNETGRAEYYVVPLQAIDYDRSDWSNYNWDGFPAEWEGDDMREAAWVKQQDADLVRAHALG